MNNFNTRKYGPSTRDIMLSMVKNQLGEYGKEILNFDSGRSATTKGAYFRQILFLSETTISEIKDYEAEEVGGISDAEALVNVPIPAGITIFGLFRDISISSGVVVCYREDIETPSAFQGITETPSAMIDGDGDLIVAPYGNGTEVYYTTDGKTLPAKADLGSNVYKYNFDSPIPTEPGTLYTIRAYRPGRAHSIDVFVEAPAGD